MTFVRISSKDRPKIALPGVDRKDISPHYTCNEVLCQGLELGDSFMGLSTDHLFGNEDNASLGKCIEWFIHVFGPDHITVLDIWIELQTTGLVNAKEDKTCIKHLLAVLFFIKSYKTHVWNETVLIKYSKTICKWTRFFIPKIAALRAGHACLLGAVNCDLLSFCTVCYQTDGQAVAFNPAYYSHKSRGYGIQYEIVLAAGDPLVWVNGPYPGSWSDGTIHESTSRDEMFEQMVREYNWLSQNSATGSSAEWHKLCFRAVVALCQCQIENRMEIPRDLVKTCLWY